MVGALLTLGFGVACAMAPNYGVFVAMLFLAQAGQTAVFQTCFILGVENVGRGYRVICAVVIEFFFVAGKLLFATANVPKIVF